MKANASTVSAAPAAPSTAVYEVTVDGPLKVGGVITARGARLNLTAEQAEALNKAVPGAVKLLGV